MTEYQYFDPTYLKSISFDDKEFTIEIIETFMDTINNDLINLEESLSENDYDAASKFAHKIKSNIKILLCNEAFEIIEQIERFAIKKLDDGSTKLKYERLKWLVDQSKMDMKAFIRNLS